MLAVPFFLVFIVVAVATTLQARDIERLSGGDTLASLDGKGYLAHWVSSNNEIFCTGAIIGESVVVVSASCIVHTIEARSVQDKTFIVAGVQSISQIPAAVNRYEVRYTVSHPNYGGSTGNDTAGRDIGLVFVSHPFNFTDTGLSAITLPHNDEGQGGIPVNVLGFSAEELVVGDLEMVSGQSAQPLLPQGWIMREDEIYARNTKEEGQSCNGTLTGNPLVHATGVLFGLQSRLGLDCTNTSKSGVFTRVSQYYTWINRTQAMFIAPTSGVLTYTLEDSFEINPFVTSSPTSRPVRKNGIKTARRRHIRKRTAVVLVPEVKTYQVLVPRDLKSVTFRLFGGSCAGLRVAYNRPKYDCISTLPNHEEHTCEFLGPMEGIYTVEAYALDPLAGCTNVNLTLVAEFEHRFGSRLTRSVYNKTLGVKKQYSYLSIPVVPGTIFTAQLTSLTRNTRQRLLIGSGVNALRPSSLGVFCDITAQGEPVECQFTVPSNTTAITLTLLGDSTKPSDTGLSFLYTRLAQESGFPLKAHYTSPIVPRGRANLKQYQKAGPAGTEVAVKFELLSGRSSIRVFFGPDSNAWDSPECVLQAVVPGTTLFCSVIVPPFISPTAARVFVETISKQASTYEMTILFWNARE